MAMEEFRNLLRSRLRERGALARLSEFSDIPSPVIGRWRDGIGRPTDTNLKKLAPALGASYEDLAKMCGYLPGEPSADTDPQLLAFLAAVEAGWLAMDDTTRELAERGARALFAVQPARGASTRHRDGASTPRSGGRRHLDAHTRPGDDPETYGSVPTVYPVLRATAAYVLSFLKRPSKPSTAWSAA